MASVKRREFLTQVSGALGGALLIPFCGLASQATAQTGQYKGLGVTAKPCWLDVTAPFVVEDAKLGIHSEIVLTADTFIGARGYESAGEATDYEIFLYDANGKSVGTDGVAKRLSVGAMETTVLRVSDMLGEGRDFFGGARIRLRPRTKVPMHASNLFSSAFLRLTSDASFDNVHANPDPLEWQRPASFYYSMPFPPLRDYECVYCIFNPYDSPTSGSVTIYDPQGKAIKDAGYQLKPHASLLFDLRKGGFVTNLTQSLDADAKTSPKRMLTKSGGTIAVVNTNETVKNFGYLLIKRPGSARFSIDHPIHQSPFVLNKSKLPFDAEGRFRAKNILFTPLVFHAKKMGGITLESRFHLSSGAPMEEFLWLRPFVTDPRGEVVWQPTETTKLPATIPDKQTERGAIKLAPHQNCVLDAAQMDLPANFSGGLSLAISPVSNHTLMKIEVLVPEWGAHAFTHFRPGLGAARAYQKPAQRGGLGTDYITSGARLERKAGEIVRDEIICVQSIADAGRPAQPTLEVFDSHGFVTRVKLDDVPSFSCQTFLLSDLLANVSEAEDLTLRLVADRATLLMSIVHLDYQRRDLALDHGSDRFSTFEDFDCEAG